MSRYLAIPSLLLTADKAYSATQEAGLAPLAPTEASVSGSLKLSAAGVPSAAVSLDLKLQTGGNPLGYDATRYGLSSASLLQQTHGGGSYQGFLPRIYANQMGVARRVGATATAYHFWPSKVVRASDDSGGFASYNVRATTDRIQYLHTDGPTGDGWTLEVIFTDGDDGLTLANTPHRPALIVRPDGRLMVYFIVLDPYGAGDAVTCYSSTDDGATWSLYQRTCVILNDGSHDLLDAIYVDGDVVMVTGNSAAADVEVYLSSDDGASFTMLGNGNTTYYRPSITALSNGQWLIHADDNAGGVFVIRGAPGSDADDIDGIEWAQISALSGGFNQSRTVVRDDDGALYLYSVEQTSAGPMQCFVSTDEGETWSDASPDSSGRVFSLMGSSGDTYIAGLNGGWFNGYLVTVGVADDDSGDDGTPIAIFWGGWDSLTDRPVSETSGTPYNACYLAALCLPTDAAWTKTDSGGGATVDRTATGILSIISSAGGNSYYSAPTTFYTSTAHLGAVRERTIFRVNSGGSVAADTIMPMWVSGGDGLASQWFKIRVDGDNMAIIDVGGSIAATAFGAATGLFTDWTELFVAFVKGGGSTSAKGLLSVWYRTIGSRVWVQLADGIDVAEDGGATTSFLRFGGTNNAAADWEMHALWGARESNGMADWAGESALVGRSISPLGVHVPGNITVSAYGSSGRAGDTWWLQTGYLYGKEWTVQGGPGRRWRSTADASTQRIVYDAGASDMFDGDIFAVLGTNVSGVTLKFNTSDSWASPAVSIPMSSIIASSVSVATFGKGYIELSNATFRPHELASRPGRSGRRFWVRFSSGATYRIDDNPTATRLMLYGSDVSALSSTVTIFTDSMWARGVSGAGYRYMALEITNQNTADDYYEIGQFVMGYGIELTRDDGFEDGWSRRYLPNVEVMEPDSGARLTRFRGAMRRTLAIRWSPKYLTTHDGLLKVREVYRRCNGPETPFLYVHNPDKGWLADGGGYYRWTSDLSEEQVHGEDFFALGQITAEEEVE